MAKTISALEIEFEGWRTALQKRLSKADAHLQATQAIQDLIVLNRDELNIAPGFWSLTIRAHLHTGLLDQASLVDRNPRSNSMFRMLDFVEQNTKLFSEALFRARLVAKGNGPESVEDSTEGRSKVSSKTILEHRGLIVKTEIKNLQVWRVDGQRKWDASEG
jgi:hypothetical protein